MAEQHMNPEGTENLSRRVALLEGELARLTARRSSTRARTLVALAALGVCTLVAGFATSQEEGCSDALPFCFQTGGAVRATEFNQNFAALADALANKVDQTPAGDIDVAGTLGLHIYTKACTAVVGESECTCEAGELALSGGASAPTNGVLSQSRPRASAIDTWQVRCTDLSGNDVACTSVRAICARVRSL
ncbi:MAG TPA: hypothetical protein VI197_30370 [Polyangiaceae bacterium]